MNKLEHAFDPALSQLFSLQNMHRVAPGTSNEIGRQLFYQLQLPGKYANTMPWAYDFILKGLNEAERVYAAFMNSDYSVEKLASLQTAKIAPLPEQFFTQDNLQQCVKQTAPILLTQPCWLQNIAQISCCQADVAVQLMSIYLQLTRVEQGGAGLQDAYHALLMAGEGALPPLHSFAFIQQTEIKSEIFDFAAIQLAWTRFPRVLFPEILGFTLAYCQFPTPIEVCYPAQHLASRFFFLREKRVKRQIPLLLDCITGYLDLFPLEQQSLWRRIQNGFWLYQLQMQRCRDQFNLALENQFTLQQKVAMLFQQKAAAAFGHHQQIQLQGISLDEWFAGMPANHQQFLQALKQSGYVDRQQPLASLLLKLFDINGPMFGVLNAAEQTILQDWLQYGLDEAPISITEESAISINCVTFAEDLRPAKQFTGLSKRQLYYYLLNADLFPEILPPAKSRVRNLLQACEFFSPLPFKFYSHERFAAYIEKIYQREINAYQPLSGKPKISKEAYIWGMEQIAPMILIDGCWLQNSRAVQNISAEISDILFHIYCDEIGNGSLQQNHPYIFQQLLHSLSIELPPVHSKEFIEHAGFVNSAFDLPVYMLSLSLYSAEFLPELLGLNMAIELSGLGKGYLCLVDELTYWGIDPTIAKIHISIDNYASGHTFLAKKAIQLYMDDISQSTADRLIQAQYWRRIYNGYASLRFVGSRFRWGLPILYLVHKVKNKLPTPVAL
jgi:heme oxygenase-like protein